tara:strand:+ start:614 stop:802 length:189 start_codon:yes stop_codon:yes gene_type:complete
MSQRQKFLDRIRDLKNDLEAELVKPKMFTKEVEPFMLREAVVNLTAAEKYLNGYLQVEKARG